MTGRRGNPESLLETASELRGKGDLHRALALYREAFREGADPGAASALKELSRAFISRELWREAETALLEGIRVDPSDDGFLERLSELQASPERFRDIRPGREAARRTEQDGEPVLSRVPLVQLFIELTNRCNARCVTCLNRSMKRPRGVMAPDLFRKIVDESSSRLYLEMVHLYGVGEDYVVPGVLEYLDYAVKRYSDKGIRTALITNGERVTDLPKGISAVDISFNAGRKETYEKITGLSFDRTVANIRRLQKEGQLGAHTSIHMLVFRENEHEVEDFKRLFAYTDANLVLAYKFDNQCGAIEDQTIDPSGPGDRIPCHYVRNVLNIGWNGDVLLCPHDFDGTVNYGNVRDRSLEDIWHGSMHREVLAKHAAGRFDGLCGKCNYNTPIEGRNAVVSREERIRLRREASAGEIAESAACGKSGSCRFIESYRERIERIESGEERPVRICSDDHRFYGIDAVLDPGKDAECPELAKLKERIGALGIAWESPVFGPSGYAFAARQYALGLADIGVDTAIRPTWGDCGIVFEDDPKFGEAGGHAGAAFIDGENRRFKLRSPAGPAAVDRLLRLAAKPQSGVHVCHHVPTDLKGRDFFAESKSANPWARRHIGYTTFETDGIPAPWVESCNRMDEIWVPSRFNLETFARAGVRREKIHVIPHGFDPGDYRPSSTRALEIGSRKSFNFLSIFEWTYRKGWDVLIRAYLEEFRPEEDVRLILRSYQGGGVIGKSKAPILEQLTEYIRKIGHDPSHIPHIEFIDAMVPADLMPSLYMAADAFILPTRGEGWGIPFTESMLMEVPVIATRWSGHLDFVNDETGYLIDIEGIVPVGSEQVADNPLYAGHRWAEPSVRDTRRAMRHVVENREEAREKGRAGRAAILDGFTTRHAALKIAGRLLEQDAAVPGKKPAVPVKNVRPARVLFQARPDVFTLPGGDTEVMLRLRTALEDRGVAVDFSPNQAVGLDPYDLVHIFNFETAFAVNAALQEKPYVVTPMHEDFARYYLKSVETPSVFRDYLESGDRVEADRGLASMSDVPAAAFRPVEHEFIAAHADAILVSGASEGKRVRDDFPSAGPIEVVKLGFNRPAGFEDASPDAFVSRYGVEDFVLCVGRLETRKNQLMLLYALQDDDIPLVFVNSATMQPGYEELCRSFRRKGKTIFTGRIGREMLFSAYKAAKVHALPSWYELPGLVSLEAAWCGCGVVASDWGTIREYMEDAGSYCDPADPGSVRNAVLSSLAAGPGADARRLLEDRTWEGAAERVHAIYDGVLRGHMKKSATRARRRRAEAAAKELEYQRLKSKAMGIAGSAPREALEIVGRIRHYRPNDPGIEYICGIACLLSRRYGDAERHFREVLEKRPLSDPKAYMYLAMAQKISGRPDAAVRTLRRAIRINPFCSEETGNIFREHLDGALREEAAADAGVMVRSC